MGGAIFSNCSIGELNLWIRDISRVDSPYGD